MIYINFHNQSARGWGQMFLNSISCYSVSALLSPLISFVASPFIHQIASVLLILHTSAMTLTIGGLFKDVLLVTFSFFFFKSPLTHLQVYHSINSKCVTSQLDLKCDVIII